MRDEELSSSLVGLDVAIQIEKGSRDFYQRAAATATDGGGRVLFAFLADAEAEHLQILVTHRRSLSTDGWCSSSEDMQENRLPTIDKGPPLYSRLSLRENGSAYVPDLLSLRVGLVMEEAAAAFYARGAESSERAEDESLYQNLLGMEKEHHRILEEEYNDLAREFSRVLGFAPF